MKRPPRLPAILFMVAGAVIFIQYGPLNDRESAQAIQAPATDGRSPINDPVERSIEGETAAPCKPTGFWTNYDIWGDTSTIYAPSRKNETVAEKTADHPDCDEPAEAKE